MVGLDHSGEETDAGVAGAERRPAAGTPLVHSIILMHGVDLRHEVSGNAAKLYNNSCIALNRKLWGGNTGSQT